jgi:hypothetical protein
VSVFAFGDSFIGDDHSEQPISTAATVVVIAVETRLKPMVERAMATSDGGFRLLLTIALTPLLV